MNQIKLLPWDIFYLLVIGLCVFVIVWSCYVILRNKNEKGVKKNNGTKF